MESNFVPLDDLAKQEDEIRAKLESFTLKTICKRNIILTKELLEWWGQGDRIERFMGAMGQKLGWCEEKVHGHVRTITHGHKYEWLLLVLSLLIQLGESDRFESFIRGFPGHSSFSTICCEHAFSTTDQKKDRESVLQFVKKFEAHKWPFRPLTLGHPLRHNHDRADILPFTKSKQIDNDKGAFACVYLVDIPAQFIEEKLADLVAAFRFKEGQIEYIQLAIKSLKSTNEQHYTNEINAFQHLEKNKNMISFLGEFQYSDFQSLHEAKGPANATKKERIEHPLHKYNIVLEPAVCDLHTYLWQADMPIYPCEIETVWNLMFRLVDALVDLHEPTSDQKEEKRKRYGWHRDIKPHNILLALSTDKNEWQFKIADPGCAQFLDATHVKFKKAGSNGKLPVLKDVMVGGRVFGPPERHINEETKKDTKVNIYQTYDVWSLGCVLSLVATWITMGQRGLHEYEWIRMEARRHIDSGYGDAFHDGNKVLGKVRDWHENIVVAARTWDKITPKMVKIIGDQMLINDPLQRSTARAIQDCLPRSSCGDAGPDSRRSSDAKISVDQQLKSTTFAQLFKLHDRNDLLLRLWQLPSYRNRGTGRVKHITTLDNNDFSGRSKMTTVTRESANLRSESSGYEFGWEPRISPGSAVSTMGEPKSRDKTEESSLPLAPVETFCSIKTARSATSQGSSSEQTDLLPEAIKKATRAQNFDRVLELSSNDQDVLKKRNKIGRTLMDILYDGGYSTGNNFNDLFWLFHNNGVTPTNPDYQQQCDRKVKNRG